MFLVLKKDEEGEVLIGVVERVADMPKLVFDKITDRIIAEMNMSQLLKYRDCPEKVGDMAMKELIANMMKYKVVRV